MHRFIIGAIWLQERRQKRVIYAALGASVLASVVWLIAICTHGWVELILPDRGVYLPSPRLDDSTRTLLVEKIWTGLWNLCRVERSNATASASDAAAAAINSTDAERPDIVKGIHMELSVPIQLAQCRFPGLAISNAKNIGIFFK